MAADEGEFPRVFRGYETDAVDRAMLRLRRELLAAKTDVDRATSAASELVEANQALQFAQEQTGNPSFAAFGHAFESILHTAQTHADSMVSSAAAEAFNLKNATERERAQLVANAREQSQQLLAHAQNRAEEILTSIEAQSAATLETARAEAEKMVADAAVEVSNARRASTTELMRDRTTAKREIEKMQAAAEREIAELKLILASNNREKVSEQILEVLRISADATAHRDEAETQYLQKHEEAVHATEQYLVQSQAELSALRQQIQDAQLKLQTLHAKAGADAQLLTQAVDERALAILTQANEAAAQITRDAEALASEIVQRAQAQSSELLESAESERESLVAILAAMKDVLTNGSPEAASRKKAARATSTQKKSNATVKAEVNPNTAGATAQATSRKSS